MRLNKFIAESGVASRRKADELIQAGAVKVNGKTVTELGTTVDEENDTVTVNGDRLRPATRYIYVMLNKPKGCVCTSKDEKGRKTVFDYVPLKERLFPVGRLDYDSEGLLLLTNDGDLAYRLTHPSHEIPKTYLAKVEGEIPESDLAKLRGGVVIDGVITHRAKVTLLDFSDGISRLEVTIYEGRNRQVRKMFEVVGKQVIFLKRIAVGTVRLGGLGRGAYRFLTPKEIEQLKSI